ncbi:MAG: glucosyltransferase [Lachnospiraceae bacterium]|nr:glucosyltransferase [Lachnospiraceae bacterium]
MGKIVFFCIPAHGHTNPTLGVVRELIERGHEVWYYSYNMLKEKIEATGAKFVPCDEYDTELKLEPKDTARVGKDLAFSTKLLVDTTLALDDMVCKDMERLQPDCIVADSMAVWGKAVALKLGIPFVSSTTTFAFNKYSAKIMKQSIGELFGMIFSMSKIQKDIKRLQDKGYPVKNVLDIIQNDEKTDTVVYTSPQFQPCADTFSDKYAFVGPSVRTVTEQIEKTKEKLIYISMGTVNNDMLQLYKNCIAAFKETEYQVIMSVGNLVDIESFEELPENISVYTQVDQIAVLSQADVFLSHCGMNSVNESLYYEVPLVMYPQTSEQGGVANRVLQLGAGIQLKKTTPSAILEAIEEVMDNFSYQENAVKIADGFRKCTGAKAAADKILSVCMK